MPGYKAAVKYGYANARVKAMEAKLISTTIMHEIASAKEVSSMLSILSHTDYEESMAEFGGIAIKSSLIDFALSKNLAQRVGKLVQIAPQGDKETVRAIVGKWDLYNAKLLIEAKDRHISFAEIDSNIIDYGTFGRHVIKEAMNEDSVETALSRLIVLAPSEFSGMLQNAIGAYKIRKKALDAVESLDVDYYKLLGKTALQIGSTDLNAARIVKMDIDMRNLLTLAKAKRVNLRYAEVDGMIIDNGTVSRNSAKAAYEGSKGVQDLVTKFGVFELADEVAQYEKDRRLLHLEVGMKNQMLRHSISLLRHSVLSLAGVIAYVYLKEIEVSTLRILLKGKQFGLSEDDVSKMMIWKL